MRLFQPQHLIQLQLGHRLGHPPVLLGAAIATHFRDELEEATHRHVAIAGRAFRQVADLLLGLEGVALDIEAEDAGRAGRGQG